MISGPATVTFANGSAPMTTASFTSTGTYVLQLSATDSLASSNSQVTITVNPAINYAGTPFPGPAAATVPGTIQAENFDNGGNGVAYNWQTTTNPGNANYRSGTGVGIETTSDTGGGDDVGYAVAGDWTKYSVNVPTPGTYSLDLRVAQQSAGGQMHVEVDGINVTGALNIPNTGGFQNWQTITATGINLTAGNHVVKISFDTNGSNGWVGNLNWFRFNLTQMPGPIVTRGVIKALRFRREQH